MPIVSRFGGTLFVVLGVTFDLPEIVSLTWVRIFSAHNIGVIMA